MLLSFENTALVQLVFIFCLNLTTALYLNYRPRINENLNMLEILSSYSSFFTACLLYLMNTDLEKMIKYLLLGFVLCFHSSFLLLLSFQFLKIIKRKYKKNLRKISRILGRDSKNKDFIDKKNINFN